MSKACSCAACSNEEKLLFPFLETKVKMPQRFSVDHETLLKHLAACKAALDQISLSGSAEEDAAKLKAFQVGRSHRELAGASRVGSGGG